LASDYSQRYGLFSNWYARNKQWAVDQDYFHKLTPEEARWLDRFNREYHAGDIRKGDPKAIHKSDELRKDCYYRNNKQNRDLLSIKSISGKLVTEVQLPGRDVDLDGALDRVRLPKKTHLAMYAIRFAATYHEAIASLRAML
jgi:hypothetical protein